MLALITLGLYWMGLGALTHMPPQHMPHSGLGDKLGHAAAFCLLGALLYSTLWLLRPMSRGLWWKTLLIVLIYGALDEWTQPLTRRTCDLWDWVCDAAGVSVAVLTLSMVRFIVQRPARQWQAAFERAINYGRQRDRTQQLRRPPAADGRNS
jgi:hypothetical protein